MNILKLLVPVRKAIPGGELERVLKAVFPEENLSCGEKMNSTGSAIGKEFLIHYPEFGSHLVMAVAVGDPAEAVICEKESYDQIWIMVQKAPNAEATGYLKDLNDPNRDIMSLCQNVRDSYERALAYVN